jgi:hypothetical protein
MKLNHVIECRRLTVGPSVFDFGMSVFSVELAADTVKYVLTPFPAFPKRASRPGQLNLFHEKQHATSSGARQIVCRCAHDGWG